MGARVRYALLLASGVAVALCLVDAPLPVSALSGEPLVPPVPFVPISAAPAETLDAALRQRHIHREAMQRLPGGGFRFVDPQPSWRPGTDALRAAQPILAASAQGDAHATYRMFEIVERCLSPPDAPTLRDCERLLAATQIAQRDWLSLAASQGSLQAGVRYATNAKACRARAATYLWRAARLGNAEALLGLAEGHLGGMPVRRDPVKAYAFYLAWVRLSPTFATLALDRRYGGDLTPAQKQTARLRSQDIHRACCRPRQRVH